MQFNEECKKSLTNIEALEFAVWLQPQLPGWTVEVFRSEYDNTWLVELQKGKDIEFQNCTLGCRRAISESLKSFRKHHEIP